MTTESNVLYTQAANPNAGAVPQLTNVATILDKIPLAVSAVGVGDVLSICCIRNAAANSATQAVINWTEVR